MNIEVCNVAAQCTMLQYMSCTLLCYPCLQVGECFAYQCCLIVGMHCLAFTALYLNGPKIQSLTALTKVVPATAAETEKKEGQESKAG